MENEKSIKKNKKKRLKTCIYHVLCDLYTTQFLCTQKKEKKNEQKSKCTAEHVALPLLHKKKIFSHMSSCCPHNVTIPTQVRLSGCVTEYKLAVEVWIRPWLSMYGFLRLTYSLTPCPPFHALSWGTQPCWRNISDWLRPPSFLQPVGSQSRAPDREQTVNRPLTNKSTKPQLSVTVSAREQHGNCNCARII